MTFSSSKTANSVLPKRAVLYLRVSTGRQAAGDVSLPSQRDLNRRYCEGQGWDVVDEYVEPGASATDDRRPVFQRMLEDAKAADRRFDVICVHSFSRFYRNGAEMELTIRKLRKLGVEVVSVTQPTGNDPAQELMRQIIGVFDEYTSRENGKNVTRAMRESAKQGFWNGAPPPLGYRAVEAERRGAKIKKKLDVDPVEAELVRLIFKLYLEGDGTTGPLGVKGVASWLNTNGYRTRRGATFGVGPLHGILTNRCYATGKWPYGVRNARTGELNDPADIVEIDVPTIIPLNVFENVQARLANNSPKVTAPRVVNGPTLLTGLAVCATCGSGMTRSGTTRRHKRYSYYSCAGCKQRGKSVCKGRNVPMEKLDTLVIEGMADKLLVPQRVSRILEGLIERHAEKDRAVQERQQRLQAEIETITAKVTRLYAAIENGVIPLDDELNERITRLKSERSIAEESLDRIKANLATKAAITPAKIDQFTKLMRERLRDGDVHARKAWLGTLIQKIEVDDKEVRISGSKEALSSVLAGKLGQHPPVLGFVRKWRALQESNLRPQD